MQNGQNLPRHFDVILGHVDRFETDQKALTRAPAGTAAPTGPATALASPGTSQTELIRVFYAVLYPDFTHTGGILANCRDGDRRRPSWLSCRDLKHHVMLGRTKGKKFILPPSTNPNRACKLIY